MSKAAIPIMVWGIYELVTGLTFLLIPNTLLPLPGFPATMEVWIRVLGILLLILSGYHIYCARWHKK